MEGPGPSPPDGWEWHWSRTFERHYLWSPTTNAVRWPPVGTESPEGTAGPAGSASEPVDEDGAAQGLPPPASIGQPDAEDSTELADDGSQAMDADSGVNEYFVDFGDLRVGFPDRKPAVTPQMHGWTYPPLIELVDRLLCFGRDAGEQPGVNVILEVGSWLGCSTRLLAQLAPQATIYTVDKWDADYLSEKDGEAAMFGGRARQGLDDAVQHTKQLIDQVPLYESFLVNLWQYRYGYNGEAPEAGVIPMRMDSVEAMEFINEKGVEPQLVYIDGDRRYTGVKSDVEKALSLFPTATIFGADYDHSEVKRAVDELANKHKLDVYAEGGKYWVFTSISVQT